VVWYVYGGSDFSDAPKSTPIGKVYWCTMAVYFHFVLLSHLYRVADAWGMLYVFVLRLLSVSHFSLWLHILIKYELHYIYALHMIIWGI
jgi:hypothetical protein